METSRAPREKASQTWRLSHSRHQRRHRAHIRHRTRRARRRNHQHAPSSNVCDLPHPSHATVDACVRSRNAVPQRPQNPFPLIARVRHSRAVDDAATMTTKPFSFVVHDRAQSCDGRRGDALCLRVRVSAGTPLPCRSHRRRPCGGTRAGRRSHTPAQRRRERPERRRRRRRRRAGASARRSGERRRYIWDD